MARLIDAAMLDGAASFYDEYGQRLRAFVALRAGVEIAEQDVKDFVRANLARFKVPRDVVFVDAAQPDRKGSEAHAGDAVS